MSGLNTGAIMGCPADLDKLSMTTATDPLANAATSATIIGTFAGVIITTTTTGNSQTLGTPSDTTAGKVFTVVNNDTSTNTVPVVANSISYTIAIGSGMSFIWDGSKWMPTSMGITSIPVPVTQGGTGLATLTDNAIYKGNGTSTIDVSSMTDTGTELTTTANLTVGATTAGKNLTVNATEGAEMSPALEGANWTCGTDGTGGWTANGGTLVKTASAGTQTATPSGTFTVTEGRTYKVVIVCSAAANSPTYLIGGVTGTTITNTTITDYIIASTTGKIIFSGGTTATCTITSISVKELTTSTGDATVLGTFYPRGRFLAGVGSTAYPAISFVKNPQLGFLDYTSNTIRVVAGGASLYQFGSNGMIIYSNTAALTLGTNSVTLTVEGSEILAQRGSTAQQILRLYNTYTDGTNYERLSLTGVQGASVNVTAETAGTGGDNLDIVLTPAGTGGVLTTLKEEIEPATDNISAAQCRGSIINNYGQANDAALTLPAIAAGMHFTVILGTTVAKYFRIDPNASDSIYLDGVTTGDGKYCQVASAAAGNAIQFVAFQTGASAWDWFAATVSGAWVAEA